MRRVILVLLLFEVFHQGLIAQEKTEPEKEPQRERKNTVRINVTNPIIFGGKSIILGYERVIGKHQTISVNVGNMGFPSLNLIDIDSLKANSILGEKGFHISVDYRFYLARENKYNAPRGVYIGPYYGYNYFERKNSWTLKSTSGGAPKTVDSKTSFSVHNFGAELGYQFIFWNRVTVDMILFGPGVAGYNLKTSLGANLSDADRQKFFDTLNEALTEKFPGYSTVVDEGEFERQGTANTTSIGFRYMIMIGFRF